MKRLITLTLSSELALSAIFFIFLGYYSGKKIGENAAIIGMFLGAIIGLASGTLLVLQTFKKVEKRIIKEQQS